MIWDTRLLRVQSLDQTVPGLRLCAYFECVNGQTLDFTCPSGTLADVSVAGLDGCCTNNLGVSFTVDDFDCAGTIDEDLHVYIRVDAPSLAQGECESYQLTYHF